MLRFAAILASVFATASGEDAGSDSSPSTTQLAALQEQLQQALDQQAQLSSQQAALTDALTPLLSWANNIAPHDTGCDLDHYTSIVSLCGADAGHTETDEVAPDPEIVKQTDTGCECMESWYYDGEHHTGCQVTNEPPASYFAHAPWCIVTSGCTGAHPGPWGAWDYCKEATNWTSTQNGRDDATRRAYWESRNDGPPIEPWLMEPQALFTSTHHVVKSPFDTYCEDPTCRYGLTRLVQRCHGTRDTVMQEVVGLLSTKSATCQNVTEAPPPPPPGSRTYQVTIMMRSGGDLDTKAVMDVIVTMLGCQESDIRDFKPTGVAGAYSFDLVTYSMHKADIDTLLEPVGDVAITTTYGYDMTDEGMGDDYNGRDDPQGSNPNSPPSDGDDRTSFLFLMFGFSTIGTLAALSFCGVVGKVRKFAGPEQFEMYDAPLMKHQRYEQPLSPLSTPDDPPTWMPQYEGGPQAGYWGPETAEVMSWDRSPDMGMASTESDDAADALDYVGGSTFASERPLGASTPEHDGAFGMTQEMPVQHDAAWNSGAMDAFAGHDGTGTMLGDDVAAAAEDSIYTGSESDGEYGSTSGTPEGASTTAGLAVAQPVEAQYAVPTVYTAEADRVAMLERQLAEAQGQLRDSLRRQDDIVRMKTVGLGAAPAAEHVGGQVKVEVYYGGGAAAPAAQQAQQQHLQQQQQPQQQQRGRARQPRSYRRPPIPARPQAPMPQFLGGSANADAIQVVSSRGSAPEPEYAPPPTDGGASKANPTPASAAEMGDATQRPYSCKFPGCNYAASQRRYLSEHERVHSGARPYRCPWEGCNYASSGSGHMSRHVRVHTGDRPYKCEEPGCGYEASQSGHLRTHMRKHTGERPFKCPAEGCDYAASRSGHLTRHMKIHERGGRGRGRGRPSKKTAAPMAAAGAAAATAADVKKEPAVPVVAAAAAAATGDSAAWTVKSELTAAVAVVVSGGGGGGGGGGAPGVAAAEQEGQVGGTGPGTAVGPFTGALPYASHDSAAQGTSF
jgi:hypothetical protein